MYSYFHRIRILDSTVFLLPGLYADRYQGFGGSTHTAGMKIQLEYELKGTGDIVANVYTKFYDASSNGTGEVKDSKSTQDLLIRSGQYLLTI